MRSIIHLLSQKQPVPLRHASFVGAALYSALNGITAINDLHSSNQLKLWVCSPLRGRGRVNNHAKTIAFDPTASFTVGSLLPVVTNALKTHLTTGTIITIQGANFIVAEQEDESSPAYSNDMFWEPVPFADVVTQNQKGEYLNPNNNAEECARSLEINLLHRWRRACDAEVTRVALAEAAGLSPDNLKSFGEANLPNVTVYPGAKTTFQPTKGIKIPCWTGIIRVQAHPAYQHLIFTCGIGRKTALGMGCMTPLSKKSK